jgi:Acetyltransferase (GNAT) domain
MTMETGVCQDAAAAPDAFSCNDSSFHGSPAATTSRVLIGDREFTIVTARNGAELRHHVSAWEDLVANALEPNVFYEPWMFLPALQLAEGEDLRIVMVFAPHPVRRLDPPILCGFFPLHRRQNFRGLPITHLGLWEHPYIFLCTPLLRNGYEAETLRAFLHWQIFHSENSSAFLAFSHVSGEGPFDKLLVDYSNERHGAVVVLERFTRAFLDRATLTGPELNTGLSGKRRKELRRQMKLLTEKGCVESVSLEPEEDVRPWIEEFMQLESKGWKQQEGTAFLCKKADRDFFTEALLEGHQRNRLTMLALKLNGRPIAMKCNLKAGKGSFAFRITYDEEYAQLSPGVHLEMENIRLVASQTEIDWMDSCAKPEHFMINRLWQSRRTLQNVLISTGRFQGALIFALLSLVILMKRQVNHIKDNLAQKHSRRFTHED